MCVCGLFLAFFATLTMSCDLRIISSLPTMAAVVSGVRLAAGKLMLHQIKPRIQRQRACKQAETTESAPYRNGLQFSHVEYRNNQP